LIAAADPPFSGAPDALVVARLLAASALLGVIVALGFQGFEVASRRMRDLVWSDLAGEHPGRFAVLAIATAGGLVLGIALRFVPGHGGEHGADGHGLIPRDVDRVSRVVGVLVVGFVGLVAGASLGPEGAILPAAAGIGIVAGRQFRLPPPLAALMPAVGIGALLAAMFGSPLAGAVPLMEMVPAGSAMPMVLLLLPSLTAAATASLTLQVMHAHPAGTLPLAFEGFHAVDLLWALLIGVVVGAVGLFVDRLTPLLRVFTRRIEARSLILTATVGGFVLGIIYVVGGEEIRFAGIPELLQLTAGNTAVGAALAAVALKTLATSWCLASGYRGGKIFPIAFIGGAAGLALHLMIGAIPMSVAVGCGIAAALATGMRAPVTAALVAASILGSSLLPLAVLCVVCAHATYLLADALRVFQLPAGSPPAGSEPEETQK
jgi:H+/Cl- antiporter ClcA